MSFHYFGSTAFNWVTGTTRQDVLEKLAKLAGAAQIKRSVKSSGGLYAWTCRVEADESAEYSISNYRPTGVPTSSGAEYNILDAKGRHQLINAEPNPCHMVCDGVADEPDFIGQILAEDAAQRDQRQPVALSKVQSVALFTALAMALEVQRTVGESVRVTIQIDPTDEKALSYVVTSVNGEAVQLRCSSTTLDRLAQMAALLAKGE